MTRQFSENDPNQHVSPVSALSPQTHFDTRDRDANAPEVVDVAMTPSTFVASPATDYSHPRTATSSHADGTDEGAKEAVKYDDAEKIAIPVANEYQNSPYPQVIGDYTFGQQPDADAERNAGAPASTADQPPAKIMGLKRRTFFIILIIVCIIIAVAIGGGVGGALGSKKSHSPATEPSATSTSSSASGAATTSSTTGPSSTTSGTPTTTKPSSTKSSTSSAPSATATFLNQTDTDSGHFFQGFSDVNMTGEYTDIISEVEGADFKFDVHSYEWIAKNTNCCLSFCHNATEEGWAGYVCQSKKQNQSSAGFSRVFVWCNNKQTEDIARGRCAE